MKAYEPRVTGPKTKNANKRYRLGKTPQRAMASQNAVKWTIIEAITAAYGSADYRDLACAYRDTCTRTIQMITEDLSIGSITI